MSLLEDPMHPGEVLKELCLDWGALRLRVVWACLGRRSSG